MAATMTTSSAPSAIAGDATQATSTSASATRRRGARRYIGYYWSVLAVMLWLYAGIYRCARDLQLKAEEKQRRVRKMHEMSLGGTTGTSTTAGIKKKVVAKRKGATLTPITTKLAQGSGGMLSAKF